MKKKAIVFTIVVLVVILGISIMYYKAISIEKNDMRNVDEDTETNIVETTVLEDAEKNTVEYYVNNELNEAIGTVKENTEEEISFYVNNEHNATFGTISSIGDNVIITGVHGETLIGGTGYASNLKEGDPVYLEFNTFEEKEENVYIVDITYMEYSDLDEPIPKE